MTRKTASSTDATASSPVAPSSEAVISKEGEILLEIKDAMIGARHHYRCSRTVLRTNSEYFDVLLDPIKFSEGIAIEAKLHELSKQYTGHASTPASKLPTVVVSDVGQLPKACVSSSTVLRLFLKILHDPDTPWPVPRSQSVNLVALLAIVADRLAAIRPIREYLRVQKMDTTLLKDRRAGTAHQIELDNRQRLLAGLTFDFPAWVRQCSTALIIDGPKRRPTTNLESGEDEEADDDALWWRVPNGVEEELACRREYVLDTISSIQKHFLNLYIKKSQCRLGYGSSPQCDSFQLGEMLRFLTRKGTIMMESALSPSFEEAESYTGSINDVIARLRECPSYQVDENHSHCGLRTRLLPILDRLDLGQVAMCLACWDEDRVKESWFESPGQGSWEFRKRDRATGCQEHRHAKAMFTAAERDWTPAYTGVA